MILYRPVGMDELRLIYGAGMRSFPPRLPEQPIFYPVLKVHDVWKVVYPYVPLPGSACLAEQVERYHPDNDEPDCS